MSQPQSSRSRNILLSFGAITVVTFAVGAYQTNAVKSLLLITGTLTFLTTLLIGIILVGVKIGKARARNEHHL